MTNVTLFKEGQVSVPGNLANALRQTAALKAQGTGLPFLKLRKQDGQWEYGAESVEVAADDEWAINYMSFKMGLIGWKGGKVVGEIMFPIHAPQEIDESQLEPINTGNDNDGWKEQVSVELKRLSDGTEVLYKTTSYGGKQVLLGLMQAIGDQLEQNPALPIAKVKLGSDSYKHKSYGLIYNPVLEVLGWLDPDGKGTTVPNAPTPRQLV